MVTKETTTQEHWSCGICGNWNDSKEKAEACENKGYVKIKIGPYNHATDEWKRGDIAVVHIHEQRDHLGMIVDERREEQYRHSHDIIPVWLFLDIGMKNHDTWSYEEVIFVDANTKRRIKRWAHILDNLAEIRKKELK